MSPGCILFMITAVGGLCLLTVVSGNAVFGGGLTISCLLITNGIMGWLDKRET